MVPIVQRYAESHGAEGRSGPGMRGSVPVAWPSLRGRPARVIRATEHLPAAMAWAAWPICAR
ncbi:Uncharacterised protein [Bordetella pertussis]|nr:Uncharacterised protein [Bordetella pertussis]